MQVIGGMNEQRTPIIVLNPTHEEWKKMYLDLEPFVASAPDAFGFDLTLDAILDAGKEVGICSSRQLQKLYTRNEEERKVDLALPFHYVIGDVLAAIAAWTALYSYRKVEIERVWASYTGEWKFDDKFALGLLFVPLFWLGLYAVMGMYLTPDAGIEH